jgi:hypothetical protein
MIENLSIAMELRMTMRLRQLGFCYSIKDFWLWDLSYLRAKNLAMQQWGWKLEQLKVESLDKLWTGRRNEFEI